MRSIRSAAAFALLLASTSAVYAQETTSTVRGDVADASGNPVANATVSIRHEPSGTTVRTTTDNSGVFYASGLRVGGPFTVRVEAPNFDPASLTDVQLTQGEVTRIPVQLQSTAIVVTGTRQKRSAAYNLSTGPVTAVNAEEIKSIASVNRDIRDIVRRSPFATLDPSNSRSVNIAGSQGRFNRFSIDGARFNDPFGLNIGGLPTPRGPVPLDAVEQVQVKAAPYDITSGDLLGGDINLVLKSGGNRFTGSAFYSYFGNGLVGGPTGDPNKPATYRAPKLNITSDNFGGFISGPIIKDKLFFAFSYERLKQATPLTNGFGPGVGNQVPNVTQALIDQISQIARTTYNYDTLGAQTIGTENDEKATAKVDWNISDRQRLSFSYIYQDNSDNNQPQNTSTQVNSPALGLQSNGYVLGQRINSGILQLNSQWSPNFSTETRITYRNYDRTQVSLGDRRFAQFRVCATPTNVAPAVGNAFAPNTCFAPAGGVVPPLLSFGPDISRQANLLNTETWQGDITARYQTGDHIVKFNFTWQHQDVYNLFVQNATGNYFFRSFADLQSGTATQLTLAQATPGNDPAARYNYNEFTFGIQDSWDVTSKLNIIAGVRYDFFVSGSKPVENPFFVARQGFSNTITYDGKDLIQPRFGFTWKPEKRTVVRGGFGLFGAGTPDVWLSNSFSNTGILTNTVTFQRVAPAASNNNTGFTTNVTGISAATSASVAALALNNVNGRTIDPAVVQFIQTNTAALANAPVNSLSQNFKIPSSWKASGSVDYRANLGFLGDNWNFGADFLYTEVNDALDYTDARSVRCAAALPDGRPLYTGFGGNTTTCTGGLAGGNQDLILRNNGKGRGFNAVARFDKRFDFGFYFGASYTYSNVKDVNQLSATTAGSGYSGNTFRDPNFAAYGRSSYETRNQIKFSAGYDHAFYKDYKTRVQLFGEWRNGLPYSLTFNDTSTQVNGRSTLFGISGSGGSRNLLYVPNVSSQTADPLVSYDSAATFQAFQAFVQANKLKQGSIIGKNTQTNPDFFKIDLHVDQEVPLFVSYAGYRPRARLFVDVENLLNLINREWGQLRQVNFPGNAGVVNVACATPGQVPCAQYRYSNFAPPTFNVITTSSGQPVSLWSIRIGAKFEF
jgi:hypothetical protein